MKIIDLTAKPGEFSLKEKDPAGKEIPKSMKLVDLCLGLASIEMVLLESYRCRNLRLAEAHMYLNIRTEGIPNKSTSLPGWMGIYVTLGGKLSVYCYIHPDEFIKLLSWFVCLKI